MKLAILLLTAFLTTEAGAFYPAIGPLVGAAGMAEWLKSQQDNNNGGLTNGQLDAINTMPCSNPGDASCSTITGQPPAAGQLGENEYFESFNGTTMFCVGAGAGAAGPPFCQPCDKSCQEQKVAQAHETRQKDAAKLKKNAPSSNPDGSLIANQTPSNDPTPGTTPGGQNEDLIALTNGGGVMAGLTQNSDSKTKGTGGADKTRSGTNNATTGGAYDPQGNTAYVPQPSTEINGTKIEDLTSQVANTLSGLTGVTGQQSGYRPGYTAAVGPAGSGGGSNQQSGGGFVVDCAGSFESICTGGRKASNVAFDTARKLGDNLDKDAKGAGFQGTGTGNKSFGK